MTALELNTMRDADIAHAILILKEERATEGVMHALSLLERALPLSGTTQRRTAFAVAHERRA